MCGCRFNASGGSVTVGAAGEAATSSAAGAADSALKGSSTFLIHAGHSRASGLSKVRLRFPGESIGGLKRGDMILGFCCRCFIGVELCVRLTGVSRAASTSCSSAAKRAVLVMVGDASAAAIGLVAAAICADGLVGAAASSVPDFSKPNTEQTAGHGSLAAREVLAPPDSINHPPPKKWGNGKCSASDA